MYNKITFNVEYTRRNKRSQYDPEREAMHEFLASDHENMCLEYGTEGKARLACAAIKKYAAHARQPLKAMVRGCNVIVTRTDREKDGV
jgi:hypothetical protein